jgi:hypothetical protein
LRNLFEIKSFLIFFFLKSNRFLYFKCDYYSNIFSEIVFCARLQSNNTLVFVFNAFKLNKSSKNYFIYNFYKLSQNSFSKTSSIVLTIWAIHRPCLQSSNYWTNSFEKRCRCVDLEPTRVSTLIPNIKRSTLSMIAIPIDGFRTLLKIMSQLNISLFNCC